MVIPKYCRSSFIAVHRASGEWRVSIDRVDGRTDGRGKGWIPPDLEVVQIDVDRQEH